MLVLTGGLHEDDIRITGSGATGRDLLLSPAAQKIFPFATEIKNVEHLNVREAFAQARTHAKPGEIPVLFHMKNKAEMLVTMNAYEFLLLITKHLNIEADERLREDYDDRLSQASEQEGA